MRTQRHLLVLLVMVLAAGRAVAQSGTYSHIVKYVSSGAESITAGPDGALWFTNGSSIGRITTAGAITEYPLPSPSSYAVQLTVGPDGALWFTDTGISSIGRITTAGIVTDEFPVPSQSSLKGITAGPDGALWFIESYANQIGRMTTAGVFTEYPLYPTYGLAGYPEYITTGPDGALWFTYDGYGGYPSGVVRITTAGNVTVYGVAPGLQEITTGSDGALWSAGAGSIWRITTAGVATEYPVPLKPSGGGTGPIATGPDGALWFTVACNPCATSWIGRLTPSGLFTEYDVGRRSWLFGGIAAGPDGGIWFTTSMVAFPAPINYIARAPACGLGLSGGYDGAAITTTFDLGTAQPAVWNISLQNTIELEKPTRPVSPPRFITLNWNASGFTGSVLVKSALSDFTGQVMCAEWTTVNTAAASKSTFHK